jgi:hypothetical protein
VLSLWQRGFVKRDKIVFFLLLKSKSIFLITVKFVIFFLKVQKIFFSELRLIFLESELANEFAICYLTAKLK